MARTVHLTRGGIPEMGDESFTVALISAVVALAVLAIERWASHITSSRDLRRRGLEEWLSSLAIWVDEHRDEPHDRAADSLMKKYQQLTNRQVLELRFERRDRYVAWWMHEMVLALLDEEPQPNRAEHRDSVLRDTGEGLLKWHHGEVKSRDFHIPYALRQEARDKKLKLSEVAADLQLSECTEPRRMTMRRKQHIASLVSEPESGRPLLTSLGFFVGKNNVIRGFGILIFKAMSTKVKLVRGRLRLSRSEQRLAKAEARLAETNGRLVELQGQLDKLQHQAGDSTESTPPDNRR